MSSVYPSYGGMQTLPCQRCSKPLLPNEPHCRNCGYYNTPGQGNNPAQNNFAAQKQPGTRNFFGVSATPAPPAQSAASTLSAPQQPGAPSTDQVRQPPFRVPPGGPNGQAPFSPSLSMPAGQQSYPSVERPAAQQPAGVPPSGSFPLYGYRVPPQEPITGQSSFGTPLSVPGQSGIYPSGATRTPQKPDFKASSAKQRPPKARLIALVVVLLIVLAGGSFVGYLFLSQRNAAQVTQAPTVTMSQPKGSPVFTDTFRDNNKGWNLQSYPGTFSVTLDAGALVLEDDKNQLLWELLPGGKTYGDFTLMVDATLSNGEHNNGYGIYIRGASNQNTDLATYYRFEFYGDGSYAIFKGTVDANGTTASSKIVDFTIHPAIQKQGGVNHIMITAKGPSMLLAVNGQHLKTITDSNYTNGSIAFFVSNLQNARPGAQARFSNLNIYAA